MKKYSLMLIALLIIAGTVRANEPEPVDKANEKVTHSFQRSYGSVPDLRWYETEECFTAVFKQDDILQKVRYDKEGKFLGCVRYYQQKNLPVSILHKLNRKHPGKTIFGVTEIVTGENVDYHVKMFDKERWYTVKVSPSGMMSMTEKYKRAPGEQL